MAKLELARLLRGAHRRTFEDVAALVGGPVCIEDEQGRVLLGTAVSGLRFPVATGDQLLGSVVGPPGAERLARLLTHLFEREQEKLALANETLGRYKELTALYDVSAALSRVLDVQELAQLAAAHAQRFLRAREAALYQLDPSRLWLLPMHHSDPSKPNPVLRAEDGLEGRVLRTGQAELVEDALATSDPDGPTCSMLCAPLRSGETVFGILRVASAFYTRWTAGELKLVTSVAGSASSAISHALLHQEQLRSQALRSRIDRFVSSAFVEEALEGRTELSRASLAVLVCDLGEYVSSLDSELPAAKILEQLSAATCAALAILLRYGATVNTAHGELLVALVPHDDGFDAAARAASEAGLLLRRTLEAAASGAHKQPPGIGIARADLQGDTEAQQVVAKAVEAAAALQGSAAGRVLVDEHVAQAIHRHLHCQPVKRNTLRQSETQAYEVRA